MTPVSLTDFGDGLCVETVQIPRKIFRLPADSLRNHLVAVPVDEGLEPLNSRIEPRTPLGGREKSRTGHNSRIDANDHPGKKCHPEIVNKLLI